LHYTSTVGMVGVPSFFFAPVFGGFVASYFWKVLKPSIGATCLNSICMTLLGLLGGAFFFQEGIICLIILSPLFFVAVLTGALLGRILFRSYPDRLHVTILPVLFVAVISEPLTSAENQRVVTDTILVHAPPAQVWRHLTSFPPITSSPRFWLFRLGLPYPIATSSSGDFVNASRECVFSDNAIFREKVVEFTAGHKLTFDIVESPQDPELVGHLTAHRGQFVLKGNADGTTILEGSTWYTLHVRPLWYFDLWTHHVFRSVHIRVMEDIRRRAEAAAPL
jgi:hypothetical protein